MGLHGDPDDYGLPKVDIVVPDDARELDRDVIAYHRERRQQRRRARVRTLSRPFTRYGIAAPFIASAVLIALISGILMTVISPRPSPRPVQVPPTGPTRLRPGETGAGLPVGDVIVGGRPRALTDLVDVAGVVLDVPRGCHCDASVQNVVRQAAAQRLPVWLVADRRTGAAAGDVHRLAGPANGGVIAADDPRGLVSSTYKAAGLTAVLVRTDRIVREVMTWIQPHQNLTPTLVPLKTPS